MIFTRALISLTAFPACAQFRVAGRLFVAPGSLAQVRYASHKSSKALKALKSLKRPEPPKQKPKPTTKPTKQVAKVQEPPATPHPRVLSLAEQLGSKEEPTLLYRKSHWKLALACYVATGAGIWLMFKNYYINISSPVGLPSWVKTVHFVGIFFFGIGVAAAFVYPARLIRSIHAIPYRPKPDAPASVRLQIQSNNFLSFFLPAFETEVTLNEVYLGRKLAIAHPPVKDGKAFRKFFRALSPSRAFYKTRSFINKEQIVPVHLKTSYFYLKLGLSENGWQWEKNGLNRLIGVNKKW